MTRKPEIAAIVPTPPRTFAPMQTAMPMMFGPGMNWQRLTMSANSLSLIQRRFSTAIRRAQTIPPLKPQSETIRNAVNKAARGTARSTSCLCAQALALDPNLADAHLGLARALIVQWNYGSVEDFAPFVRQA